MWVALTFVAWVLVFSVDVVHVEYGCVDGDHPQLNCAVVPGEWCGGSRHYQPSTALCSGERPHPPTHIKTISMVHMIFPYLWDIYAQLEAFQ